MVKRDSLCLWPVWFYDFIFNYVYVYLCLCVGYVHMSAGTCGDQKRASGHLELELQVVLSHLTWVLGNELWCSA